jgi:hypothetical protein
MAFEDAKRQIRTNFPNVIKAFADDIKDNTVSGNACIEDLINHERNDNFLFWKAFVFDITKWQNRVFTLLAILLCDYFLWKYY